MSKNCCSPKGTFWIQNCYKERKAAFCFFPFTCLITEWTPTPEGCQGLRESSVQIPSSGDSPCQNLYQAFSVQGSRAERVPKDYTQAEADLVIRYPDFSLLKTRDRLNFNPKFKMATLAKPILPPKSSITTK